MTTHNPAALPDNSFVFGCTRFQVLTDRLIRMEWAHDGRFEDRATFAAANRALPKVTCSCVSKGKSLTLKTASLTLVYKDDGKPFHTGNLSVRFECDGRRIHWRAGQKDHANLGATLRTLDGVDGDQHKDWVNNPDFVEGAEGPRGQRRLPVYRPVNLGNGLLSRSGWSLVDDSTSIVLDKSSGRPWVQQRPAGERRDWYFLGYGLDYKAAIRDSAKVFGKQPLPPRYVFGYWWCRYWAYTDQEIEGLVKSFDSMKVPLDVMVVDMDWHLPGWTGYTWDRGYFPDPDEFLKRMQQLNLAVTLNLHPADGVRKIEEQFPAMCEVMGLNPRKTDRVPFDCTDLRFMDAYFKLLHHPDEKRGVDFWWMDWQQGEKTKIPGLDPLPWINQLHWEDMERNPLRAGKRPLIFSRYGGLGAGRYCIGFSGDTYSNWESLKFQPYFTATSANVLYGYWSHDIGGHQPGTIPPELYLRWVQFGAFSPVLRTHTSKNPEAERRFWQYPDPFDHLMMDAVRLRYELAPYIYSECRQFVENGLSLCRPLYYDWPGEEGAYKAKNQYLFGDHLLVAPVVSPVDPETELADVDVWLPPGAWLDTARGKLVQGGALQKLHYLWNEIPVFVRPGAILPGQRDSLRLHDPSIRNLLVTVYGGAKGSYTLFEDDGISAPELAQSASIKLAHSRRGLAHEITVSPATGGYKGFAWEKSLEIRLPATTPPTSVQVGGKSLKWAHRLGTEGWTYDGINATTVIRLRKIDLHKGVKISIQGSRFGAAADGLKGAISRLQRVMYYNRLAMPWHPKFPNERLGVTVAQTGNRLSRNPASFNSETNKLRKDLVELRQMLKTLGNYNENGAKPDKRRHQRCQRALALLDDVAWT